MAIPSQLIADWKWFSQLGCRSNAQGGCNIPNFAALFTAVINISGTTAQQLGDHAVSLDSQLDPVLELSSKPGACTSAKIWWCHKPQFWHLCRLLPDYHCYFIVIGKPLKLDILSTSLALKQRFMEKSHQYLLYYIPVTSSHPAMSGNCNAPTDFSGIRAGFLAARPIPLHLSRPAFLREVLKVPITYN